MAGSLSGRKIIVTSGGTREYIDDVRVITNISSGKLGMMIAEELFNRGAEVYFLHAKNSFVPGLKCLDPKMTTTQFVTVDDLMKLMKNHLEFFYIDTVIHAAAVSDFTFKKDANIKLSSSSPEAFIEYLRSTIATTPKIINLIKEWSPNTKLIGFKFTVGKSKEELIEIAEEFRVKVDADMIVANDKTEMTRLGTHRAHLILPNFNFTVDGKIEIAKGIADYLDGSVL